jgi:hypothetical protein
MNDTTNFDNLLVGYEFTPIEHKLDPADIECYVSAVGDNAQFYKKNNIAPPTALLAYALRFVLTEIKLPGGSVHAAQEMTCFNSISKSETIILSGKISQNSVRSGWRYLIVDISADSIQSDASVTGRSTILIPEEETYA